MTKEKLAAEYDKWMELQEVYKKTSDFVNKGDILAKHYTNKELNEEEEIQKYIDTLEFSNEKQEVPQLIYEIIK